MVTDLDGTLLDSNGCVHERDRNAIGRLLARGVPVSLCTGRMYSGTRAIARELLLAGPIGCVDGSHIVDAGDDRELSTHTVAREAALELHQLLMTHRPATFVIAHDTIFHDDAGLPFLPYISTWSRQARAVSSVLDRARFENGLAAVIAVGSADTIEPVASAVSSQFASHLQAATFAIARDGYRGLHGMVLRAAGISKGTALAWIARHHGVTAQEVVAVGDWLNDVPMLRAAGRSFAMAHAPDVVTKAATDRLEADSDSGGGIAEAAERAGLL